MAESAAVFERMVKVESGVDARPEHFTEEIIRILKDVSMNSVSEGQTVHHKVHLVCAEIPFNHMGNRTGVTGMCCRILRMVRSSAERRPTRFGGQRRVSTAVRYRSNWTPKAVVVLGIKASDGGIRITSPEHGHQPGTFHYIEFLVFDKIVKSTCILLRGVFRPEQANLGLRWRAQ